MLFSICFVQLLGVCAAASLTKFSRGSKIEEQWLSKRQSGPNYPAHTFDQLVRDISKELLLFTVAGGSLSRESKI
jgi:hypothetical protein